VEALRRKQEAATGQLWVDVGFHGGVVPGNADHIQPLIEAGVCAFKAFLCPSGIDEFPAATEADLRAVMPMLAAAGVPLFVHAELVSPLPAGVEEHFAANPSSYAAYLATRPPEWEVAAIRLMIDLCREYGCHVHIVHLAAAEQARPLIQAARAEGLPFTVETCPHYLYFHAQDAADGDTRFKCAPPIREWPQGPILRRMVRDGWIHTIGSDHSPAPLAIKCLDEGDFFRAWGGIASLQLLLPVVMTAMKREYISLADMAGVIRRMAAHPATLVGLDGRKGAIAPGRDADFAIVDEGTAYWVGPEMLHHRHKVSPYVDRCLRGLVDTTYLRGRKIYERGQFIGEPSGQLLERPRA
jgi:allantoinase